MDDDGGNILWLGNYMDIWGAVIKKEKSDLIDNSSSKIKLCSLSEHWVRYRLLLMGNVFFVNAVC